MKLMYVLLAIFAVFPAAATAAASGTHIFTSKRLPLTSTVVLRSTNGSAPSSSDAGAAVPEVRRRNSSYVANPRVSIST